MNDVPNPVGAPSAASATLPAGPIGVAIIGSTGSVGRQTLDVIDRLGERFRVVALAAGSASPLLREQQKRYRPSLIVAARSMPNGQSFPGLVIGPEGLVAVATHAEADIVVVASSGHAAIEATRRAIEARKTIALANKETIVCAGELIMAAARAAGVQIRPVDSEHSALWQAMAGAAPSSVSRLILTASGGPFRTLPADRFADVTPGDALSHPTWAMGGKVTIDSATLMNKGLELIEARWLFDVPYDKLDVVVHPESIVHSIVEFIDGSQIAQMGLPDMRLPIQHALTYPERIVTPGPRLSLAAVGTLRFERPDDERFPALRLARQAGELGNSFPTVLSAADEVAVEAFLAGGISFPAIPQIVERVLNAHQPDGPLSFASVAEADGWARDEARRVIAAI